MIGPLFKLFGSGWNECSQIMKTGNMREKNVSFMTWRIFMNFLLWLNHFSNCLAVDEMNDHKLWRQEICGRRMFTNYVWWRWQVGDLLVPATQSGLQEVSCCYCCRRQFWNIFGQMILSKTIWIIRIMVLVLSLILYLVSSVYIHIHSNFCTWRIFSTEAVVIVFVAIEDVNPGTKIPIND